MSLWARLHCYLRGHTDGTVEYSSWRAHQELPGQEERYVRERCGRCGKLIKSYFQPRTEVWP